MFVKAVNGSSATSIKTSQSMQKARDVDQRRV
jgi:hypothetical protein